MQGISEFDGAWTDIQITNNLVIAGAYHGIALYGAQDSTIINNSVYGYFTASNGDVDETWIGVFDSGGTHPSNVIVRNNVSSMFSLSNVGVTADHNITSTNPASLFVAFDRAKNLYDLHPAPGSALIGAGSADLAPALDIAGVPRTPPITVGAYQ
jgi:parallel beta-helix repeat protein